MSKGPLKLHLSALTLLRNSTSNKETEPRSTARPRYGETYEAESVKELELLQGDEQC